MNTLIKVIPYNLDIIRNEAFPMLNNVVDKEKIMVNEATSHYVTIDKYFKIMLYIVDLYLEEKSYSLLDAFAGIGSDTIGFMIRKSNIIKSITSIEKDKNRFDMLTNNVKLYKKDSKLETNITLLNDSIFNNLDKTYDIIYLDPPWGDDYNKIDDINILIDTIPIETLVLDILEKKLANDLIILKLPKNYNFENFKKMNINYNVYDIYKSDNSVYLNLMIIYIKSNINDKILGWNFKRIFTNTKK